MYVTIRNPISVGTEDFLVQDSCLGFHIHFHRFIASDAISRGPSYSEEDHVKRTQQEE